MKYFKVIIFLFLVTSCNLYSSSKDSLIHAIQNSKSTIEKIKSTNVLCEEEWLRGNYDTANILINEAFRLEDKELQLNNKSEIVLKEQAKTFNNLAIIYRFKGDYSKSLDNHLKALKVRESINDRWGMARSFLGIGTIYEYTGKIDLALDYKFKAKKLFEEVKDTAFTAYTLSHIASIYFNKNNIEEAQKYNMQSLMLFIKKFNAVGMMDAYSLAGEIYSKQNNYKDAIENYESALAVNQAFGLKDRVISLNINLAAVYYKQKKYSVAEGYLESALKQCKLTGAKIHFCDIYKLYYNIDSITGNYKNAFKNYQTYIIYRDSLNNKTTSESMTTLQNAFENEKIEKQKQLEALKIELAHKNEVKQQRTIIYSALIVLVLLMGVFFIVYRNSIQRKRTNKELLIKNKTIAMQKKEVDEKQKEILDSINYAQRIQKAHLPTDRFIAKHVSKKRG